MWQITSAGSCAGHCQTAPGIPHEVHGGVVVRAQGARDADEHRARTRTKASSGYVATAARQEGEDLAALRVEAERLRDGREAGRAHVPEESVDRRRPRAGRPAHGVPDPDHGRHVAAREDDLLHPRRIARGRAAPDAPGRTTPDGPGARCPGASGRRFPDAAGRPDGLSPYGSGGRGMSCEPICSIPGRTSTGRRALSIPATISSHSSRRPWLIG